MAFAAAGCAGDDLTTPAGVPGHSVDGAVRAVVVFHDTASIPAEDVALIESLVGVLSARLDSIGVAFAALSPDALATLASSPMVSMVGARDPSTKAWARA